MSTYAASSGRRDLAAVLQHLELRQSSWILRWAWCIMGAPSGREGGRRAGKGDVMRKIGNRSECCRAMNVGD